MTPPKGPAVLDQWEAHAKNCYGYAKSLTEGETNASILAEHVLTLIDLVRKKDTELGDIAMSDCSEYVKSIADKALQLTESLK